jgi:hypothetical protein
MDPVLVEYLNSGQAWVLVGSGPSTELGYPSWRDLATEATALVTRESQKTSAERARAALEAEEFQVVLGRAADAVGMDRLLEVLRGIFKPTRNESALYDALVRWPAAVYLTTNFDSEIQLRLAALGVPFEMYGNSPDHFSLLTGRFTGGVVRLHGDLSSSTGLVLTAEQYRDLATGSSFEYWRTRMTSVFQMQRVVVVGYSLKDPHVRAVLEAAKRGASATNAVCWIAPDVSTPEAVELLERYRIRVVPYPATDDHSGLRRTVQTISQFVIPREGVRIRQAVAEVLREGQRGEPAATAVYVFNRLAPFVDIGRLRVSVAMATLESALPVPPGSDVFKLSDILATKGWPPDATDEHLLNEVERRAVKKGIVQRADGGLRWGSKLGSVDEHRRQFEHLRNRFLSSTVLRVRAECEWIDEATAQEIAREIDSALTGFFKRGGLTLASVLTAHRPERDKRVPASVVGFISEASAVFESMSSRLAFWRGTMGAFTAAGDAERAYLGRLAQGFFAFHALGVFGEAAAERVRGARRTVWLVDSSLQIPALAVASPSNAAYAEIFHRLKDAGVRLFTTAKLFHETFAHLRFAVDIVNRFGSDSHNAIAAAAGDPPYWRQNLFLQGYIEWIESGESADWSAYLFAATGSRNPEPEHLRAALGAIGIEVIDFQDWPGFELGDFAGRDDYESRLKELMRRHRAPEPGQEARFESWLDEKLPPEAEAAIVVLRERDGRYGVLAGTDEPSPSWFISATSIINVLENTLPITWQPESFLAFASTLIATAAEPSSDRAFEIVLSSIAESGMNPISEAAITTAFGVVIDQATLELGNQRAALSESLGTKYTESPEEVLRRLPPSRRLLASLQISKELVDRQAMDLREAHERGGETTRRARKAEDELERVARLRRKVAERQAIAERRSRQAASGTSKKAKKRAKPND